MRFVDFFTTTLDTILGPLLTIPPFFTIPLISFFITLLTTLIYKFTTNQQLMKDLKDEIKALQTEAKQLKDKPDQAMDVQKRAMETNMKYMSHSMRPTLITFLPIILLFGWIRTHFSATGTILTLFGFHLGWFGTYFISSLLFNIILRKILKVY